MHIGFGQNTVSSLYGHQKGDHMKTIELSHKKHKMCIRDRYDTGLQSVPAEKCG